MDFGVVSHNNKKSSPNAADPGPNQPGDETGHGSGNLKHLRSEDWSKNPKMAGASEVDFSFNKMGSDNFPGFERSDLWAASGFDDGQKMLSFSSSEPHSNGGMRSTAFSISQDDVYSRAGAGFNEVMRSPFAIIKGPFTPSQWMELEVQALIYKHFVANVPVPSNLLLPLKRSLYSYGSSGSYATNFLGWGPFHLGFSRSNDPEPGRCRRTDGKKWRCSRDAVPDQKYCERHINRGRHRSRKPVEGQTGHALSGSTTTTPTITKVEPIAPPSSAPSVMSSRSPSISLGALHHQFNTGNAFSDNLVSRTQGFQGNPFTPSTGLKSKDIPFANPKPHDESSHSMFGLVTSDSLVNPSERISYINTSNTNTSLGFNSKESIEPNLVPRFTDDWPKEQPNRDSGPWPKKLKSDWTQLSMFIPDFSSSSSSPAQEKSTISPLKLSSNEIDPIHMSLGVNGGNYVGEQMLKQSWVPVSWGSSMGGPLGEVLNAPKAWNNNSPQIESSPTGVLQKSTFVSLSNNSSSRSSPTRDDNKKVPDASTLCGGLGSSLLSSMAIPSL